MPTREDKDYFLKQIEQISGRLRDAALIFESNNDEVYDEEFAHDLKRAEEALDELLKYTYQFW